MNKLENKLNKYIGLLDKDIDRLEESNLKTSSNIDFTIATVLRDVKEDLIEMIGGEISE